MHGLANLQQPVHSACCRDQPVVLVTAPVATATTNPVTHPVTAAEWLQMSPGE